MIYFLIMIVFSPYTAVIPALYSAYCLLKGKLKVEMNYWNIGLGLMFIYSIISAIFNKSILSLLGALGVFLYFSLEIFFQNYFIEIEKVNKVLKYLVYFSSIAAIVGIIEKIIFMLMGFSEHRIYSSFGNPNMAGAWFGNSILITFYLKGINKERKKNVVYTCCMTLIILALLLTESSGAFIAVIGSIFIYYLLKEKNNYKGLVIVSFIVGLIVIVFAFIQNKITDTTPVGEILNSFNSRYNIWIGALKMIPEKPILGWGLLGSLQYGSNFVYSDNPELHNRIISFLIHPHNIWLTFLVGIGIVGFCIYLYIKLNLYRDMIKLYKRNNKILPLLCGINLMTIIQGMVDCTLYAPQLGIVFIAIGAVTYNLANGKMISVHKFTEVKKIHKSNNDIAV